MAQPTKGTLVSILRALLLGLSQLRLFSEEEANGGSTPEKSGFWVGAGPASPAAWEGADAGKLRKRLPVGAATLTSPPQQVVG